MTGMRKTARVAFCGIVASLSLVIMLAAYLPAIDFVCPAVAGILIAGIAIETDFRWAVTTYVAVSLLSYLICEKQATVLFILFFGYYAFIKLKLDLIKPKPLSWAIKSAVFLASTLISYYAFTVLLSFKLQDFGSFGRWTLYVTGILAVLAMFVYDLALNGIFTFYYKKMRSQILRITR